MKTVKIDIDATGAVKIETEGFSGSACKDLTEKIEQLIGKEVSVDKKPEYDACEFGSESESQGQF